MPVAADLIRRRTYVVPGRLEITEFVFGGIPRNWSEPDGSEIQLFARSVRRYEKPIDSTKQVKGEEMPWLLYLEGGPGFGCTPPQDWPATNTILRHGYQILFLDARGTGLSCPLSASVLELAGDDSTQADYLKCFRADSIVKDCEAIRLCLTADLSNSIRQWSVMGHSFGGFCCVTYLSLFPSALREVFIDAGLPPLVNNPDTVYDRLYKIVVRRNEAFYRKFPEDIDRVKQITQALQADAGNSTLLPSGGRLTARRFQQLGLNLGFHGGIDNMHELVLRASNDLSSCGHLTRPTLTLLERSLPFDDHIIYAVLHEPIYCQGAAPGWSAEKLRQNYPQFSLDTKEPVFFTGEMIYPWMFEDYPELCRLSGPAQILAKCETWPKLYDEEVLASNQVPVYAAIFSEDMYVDYAYSIETANKIGNCKFFTTNTMYHNALRSTAGDKMSEVLTAIFALRDDVID